jgi:adenine-specific DNA-methyltransferase
VFGEENVLATFVWKRKAGGGDDSGHVAAEHDYIFCFARDESRRHLSSIMHESPSMTAKYNREERGRRYYLERLDKTALTYSATMDFPIRCPDGSFISPPQPDPSRPSTAWLWSAATVEEHRDELIFQKDPSSDEWRIHTRTWMGSTAVTENPRGAKELVAWPVPQPTSSTDDPSWIPVKATRSANSWSG